MVVLNGHITGTMLGREGHGIMSWSLVVENEGGVVSVGGTSLDGPVRDENDNFICREGCAYGMQVICSVTELFECNWEQLKGQPCRVVLDAPFGRSLGIGHFVKDKWILTSEANRIVKRETFITED